MIDPHESARLFLALSVSLGLIVAGVGNLLFSPRRWAGQGVIALAGVATATATAWLFDSPHAPSVGFVGVGLLATLTATRSGRVRRLAGSLVRPFRTARVRWAVVAVAGVAVLGHELFRFDRVQEEKLEADMADLQERLDTAEGVPVPGVCYYTDGGRAVTPTTSSAPRSAAQLAKIEQAVLADLIGQAQVIRRGPPADNSNCHGWVFTGGQHGVPGRAVEGLLADNGYEVASAPRPGDLCVYRDLIGDISHTAVVRAVLDDANRTVLVEGKWGWLGVFLHPVGTSPYGTTFAYYHSPRKSHLLATSPTSSAATPLAAAAPEEDEFDH